MHKLKIKNVRCYTDKEIEFRPGINLLIGDNSVGKTSMLRACTLVMNAFFAGYSELYTRWESARNKDFHYNYGQNYIKTISKQMSIEFDLNDSDYLDIVKEDGSIVPLDRAKSLKIEKKSKKNSNALKAGLKPLIAYCKALNENTFVETKKGIVQKNALPVYAVFTTDDIHSAGRKFDKKGFREEMQIPSFGYFECTDARGLYDLWVTRCLVLQETEVFTELNNVKTALLDVFGKKGCNILSEIKVLINKKTIAFTQRDGRVVEHNSLSDGYCRLINIVMDIAFRCALLNKGLYGEKAYKKTHGTVIIDEIDEHLHPELQVRILKALHETFPKIQFIVSTHAPLVMSSVENNPDNVVYKLEYKDGVYSHCVLNTYGLDANSILEDGMESLIRPSNIGDLIKKARTLLADYKTTEAQEIITQLEIITDPHQVDLVQLRAILNRIIMLGK